MFQHFVILLILTILPQCYSTCTPDKKIASCDSINSVKNAGEHKEWLILYINSNKDQQQIETNTFVKIPNVKRIFFNQSVNDIQENSFTALSSLQDLKFERCDLPVIKKEWFRNTHIQKLNVVNSQVTYFEAKCFEKCNNLTYLDVEGNNIVRVTANVFNGTFIEYLHLENNRILVIEAHAFAHMINLKLLDLRNNYLTSFDSMLIMGAKDSNLQRLLLENNHINYLIKDSFVACPNIIQIKLASNELKQVHTGAFNGLTSLYKLDVSFNKLESFPEGAFPYTGLPTLKLLYLHNNYLNYVPGRFLRNFPQLTEISIFGNPWQCGCYREIMDTILNYHNNVKIICADEYLDGQRPVCVVPETSSDRWECKEYITNATSLNDVYIEALKSYSRSKYLENCYN